MGFEVVGQYEFEGFVVVDVQVVGGFVVFVLEGQYVYVDQVGVVDLFEVFGNYGFYVQQEGVFGGLVMVGVYVVVFFGQYDEGYVCFFVGGGSVEDVGDFVVQEVGGEVVFGVGGELVFQVDVGKGVVCYDVVVVMV